MITPDEARDMLDRAQVDGDLGLTAEMAARAPFMAEQIASMYYEYAVLEDVGYWRQRGERFETFEEAADYRDMKCEEAPMRIVRRLVSDPEVVE